jgi:hypothetical protein
MTTQPAEWVQQGRTLGKRARQICNIATGAQRARSHLSRG